MARQQNVSEQIGKIRAAINEAENNLLEASNPRSIPLFEESNQRATFWIDRRLLQQFEGLAYRESASKTALLNEAIADLLKKHSAG